MSSRTRTAGDPPRSPPDDYTPASLSCVLFKKSLASWRSQSCSDGSPLMRLTIRPRFTAGRARPYQPSAVRFLSPGPKETQPRHKASPSRARHTRGIPRCRRYIRFRTPDGKQDIRPAPPKPSIPWAVPVRSNSTMLGLTTLARWLDPEDCPPSPQKRDNPFIKFEGEMRCRFRSRRRKPVIWPRAYVTKNGQHDNQPGARQIHFIFYRIILALPPGARRSWLAVMVARFAIGT
jgi:hypothetical protein